MKKKILFDIDLSDIHNMNEDLVIELLKNILDKATDVCKCKECIEDMYALSLLRLGSQYHPNQMMERYSEKYNLSQQTHNEKAKLVVKDAIDVVQNNPHH